MNFVIGLILLLTGCAIGFALCGVFAGRRIIKLENECKELRK